MSEEFEKNQNENEVEKAYCPRWFNFVTCTILYRYNNETEECEVLLIERKKGKWAIPGGDGAFEKSESPPDFARREIEFDLGVKNKKLINTKELKEFKTIIDKNKLSWKIIMFFYCNGDKHKDEIEENKKNNLIEVADCDWFTIKEIKEREEKGEIAFDNAKILYKFWEEILSNLC